MTWPWLGANLMTQFWLVEKFRPVAWVSGVSVSDHTRLLLDWAVSRFWSPVATMMSMLPIGSRESTGASSMESRTEVVESRYASQARLTVHWLGFGYEKSMRQSCPSASPT